MNWLRDEESSVRITQLVTARSRQSASPYRCRIEPQRIKAVPAARGRKTSFTHADRTIRSPRQHMGTGWTFNVDGRKFTPQQISAHILQKLKKDAEAYLGETITGVPMGYGPRAAGTV